LKIAISTDGDFVSPHFGRCPAFTLVEIGNKKTIEKETIENPGHNPGYLPQFFHERGVNCIIAGGMGAKASDLFRQYGIEAITGISGSIDGIIDQLVKGTLQGGESLCQPGAGKGYGLDKSICDHSSEHEE